MLAWRFYNSIPYNFMVSCENVDSSLQGYGGWHERTLNVLKISQKVKSLFPRLLYLFIQPVLETCYRCSITAADIMSRWHCISRRFQYTADNHASMLLVQTFQVDSVFGSVIDLDFRGS